MRLMGIQVHNYPSFVGCPLICMPDFASKLVYSRKNNKKQTIYIPILSEWNQLISEFNLTCYLEDVNITKIDGKRYYFINIGSRKKQFHSPKDQFNGTFNNGGAANCYQ